jgi:hypothetical protein
VLDANANGLLSREEFDGGLKECRDLAAALGGLSGASISDTAQRPDAEPLYQPSTDDEGSGSVAPLTWGVLRALLASVDAALISRAADADAAWARNDSRGKGRIDMSELRKARRRGVDVGWRRYVA